ncbi:MAG: hypothetical protein AB4058_12450 [Microcystaceae cyanobacterium]
MGFAHLNAYYVGKLAHAQSVSNLFETTILNPTDKTLFESRGELGLKPNNTPDK